MLLLKTLYPELLPGTGYASCMCTCCQTVPRVVWYQRRFSLDNRLKMIKLAVLNET